MNHEQETYIKDAIAKFVATVGGRFNEHCSEPLLVGLLLQRMCREAYRKDYPCRAQAALSGDPNATYDAAVTIFESLLEGQCGVATNGHHLAQAFGKHMDKALASKMVEWAPEVRYRLEATSKEISLTLSVANTSEGRKILHDRVAVRISQPGPLLRDVFLSNRAAGVTFGSVQIKPA